MPSPDPEVADRKLAALRRFIADLGDYAKLEREDTRRQHRATSACCNCSSRRPPISAY
jgi:hypothetical protein